MTLSMDLTLARRLERAEAAIGASFVPVRQRLAPAVGAAWHELDGTCAIFDGVDSPFTQSFGLGLHAPVTRDTLAAIEAFFTARSADAMHEVSSLAGIETLALLVACGYRPVDLSTVLVQPLADVRAHDASPEPRARRIGDPDHAAWIDASIAGWADDPASAGAIRSIAESAAQNRSLQHFVVEHEGAAVATGSLGIHDGIALLVGASTTPAARNRGAQGALLGARLDEARRHGCELAMMVATPGSTSQRNAERRGFLVAYTRIKWRRSASN